MSCIVHMLYQQNDEVRLTWTQALMQLRQKSEWSIKDDIHLSLLACKRRAKLKAFLYNLCTAQTWSCLQKISPMTMHMIKTREWRQKEQISILDCGVNMTVVWSRCLFHFSSCFWGSNRNVTKTVTHRMKELAIKPQFTSLLGTHATTLERCNTLGAKITPTQTDR